MKIKNKFILYSIFIFALWGCDDATEIFPSDEIAADEALTSPTSIELALNGAMQTYSPYNQLLFSSIFTDETRLGDDNGGQNTALHNLVLVANTAEPTAIFANLYNSINGATRVIEAIELLDFNQLSDADQQNMNFVRGQALGLRALAHFEALQYYSTDYNQSSLGVPYVDYVVTVELPSRNTVGEVVTGILNDIDTAENLLESSTNKYYFNNNSLKALKSRLLTYLGGTENYNSAITLADELIAEYPLASQEQYEGIFADLNDDEIIMSYARTITDTPPGLVWYFTGTGGAKWEMSEGLYNELNDNDIRKGVLLDTEVDGGAIDPVSNPPTTLYIGKYPGKQGFYGLNDYKLFRVSEQYLLKAESQAFLNNLTGAQETLQELKDARYSTSVTVPNFSSTQEAIEYIVEERRIELAYEGFRYIDLKRTRDIRNEGMVRYENDCGGGTPCELLNTDHRWTLPIPQAELDANINMEQNPGY